MSAVKLRQWRIEPEEWTLETLARLGEILDRRPAGLGGATGTMAVARALLRVRTKEGATRPLVANAAQCAFEMRHGRRNIVLKARQLGMTSWAAARFFLKTITHPGTLTLEVAHTQEAAEDLFRIVHRFLDWLPAELRSGPLRTSRANTRQLIFPEIDAQYRVVSAGERNAGRGLTVQNLHCSEVARWSGDAAETLAGLRAALAPEGELILESTPEGLGGCFYDEWQRADERGQVRHFLPWWLERRYRAEAVAVENLTGEERALIERHGLSREQIGFRRQMRASFRGLAAQEFAEDAESCFLISGECIFERSAVEARLCAAPAPVERRRNGELEIWLPPTAGRQYLLAVDPAGGGSEGDYSAIEILDMATAMQCAEFAGHLGAAELAGLIGELARHYNDAWVVVERNNHGSGVLAHLERGGGNLRIFRQNGQAGWLTNAVSRPAVLGRLDAALVEQAELFASRKLLAECRNFVRLPNGKTGARAGTHDDRVMAMAIALGAREEILALGGRAGR